MTAPLAEIVEEGRRLPLGNDEEAFNTRGAWFSVNGSRLLAVAAAAAAHVDAKERFLDRPSGGDEIEDYRLVDAMDDTYADLRSAVRGES